MLHLAQQKPSDIQAVFISDLHLSAHTPRLIQGFLSLMADLNQLPNLGEVYIVGDWLDAWLGDDDYLSLDLAQRLTHWLSPVLEGLMRLSDRGVQIFILRGNRDFTLGQDLCNTFKGRLLDEPFYVSSHRQKIRLEHGDALCTDDLAYQKYRKVVRNPLIHWLLLHLPLSYRKKLARNIKNQSQQDKAQKSADIMDVNDQAVQQALGDCDVLLHGHTHRPKAHQYATKQRLVLGDWREVDDQVQAIIAILTKDRIELVTFTD